MTLRRLINLLFGKATQMRPYCAVWDEKLNSLIDTHEGSTLLVVRYGAVLRIGDVDVWVANRPYAFGNLYQSGFPKRYPSIKTLIRLDRLVTKLEKRTAEEEQAAYLARLNELVKP